MIANYENTPPVNNQTNITDNKSNRISTIFPDEILLHILTFLPMTDVGFESVSKKSLLLMRNWKIGQLNVNNNCARLIGDYFSKSSAEHFIQFVKNYKIEAFILDGKFKSDHLNLLKGEPVKELSIHFDVDDQGLTCLKELPLKSLQFWSKILQGLTLNDGFNSLSSLRFINCPSVNDETLAAIKDKKIKELTLRNVGLITDKGFVHLSGMNLNLFSCFPCDQVTDTGLMHLQNHELTTFQIFECPLITNKGIEFLENKKLTSLAIMSNHHNHNITNEGLAFLSKLPLTHLHLNMPHIDNRVLKCLKGKRLEMLNITRTRITDEWLAYLEGMPLKLINFNFNRGLTDKAYEYLSTLPLTQLMMVNCSITDEGHEMFKSKVKEYMGKPPQNVNR